MNLSSSKAFSLFITKGLNRKESIREAVLKGGVLNSLAKLCGYARSVAIAVLLGFSLQVDAYFLATGLIGIFLIFATVFDSIGVPNLVRAREENTVRFDSLASLLLSFTLLLAVSMTFLMLLLTPILARAALGYTPEKQALLQKFLFLLSPYLFFYFLFHHFGAVLRAKRLFSIYFLSELLFFFLAFLFTTTGLILYKNAIVLPISTSLAQMAAAFFIAYMSREHLHLSFFLDETALAMFKQFFYLVGVFGVLYLYILSDRVFATYLPAKSISALAYGLTLASVPRDILKLENIYITPLTETNVNQRLLNRCIVFTFLISLPFCLFLFFCSEYVIRLFFGYGAFSFLDIDITTEATRYYVLSLPFLFLWPIFYRIFQIWNDLRPVFFIAILGVILNIAMNYMLLFVFKLGLKSLPLATLIAYMGLTVSSYLLILQRRDKHASVSCL